MSAGNSQTPASGSPVKLVGFGCVGCLGIMFIFGIMGSTCASMERSGTKASAKAGDAPASAQAKGTSPTPGTPPDCVLDAQQLLDQYKGNEVGADEQFKGKLLEITGQVEQIKKDMAGNAYLLFVNYERFGVRRVQCYFDKQHMKQLAKLQPSEKVTVVGRCSGLMMNVQLKDCYQRDPYGLAFKAEAGEWDEIAGIVKETPDLDINEALQNDGTTLLYFAARDGKTEMVKTLLAKGANPMLRTYPNDSSLPIHIAAYAGNKETVALLLDKQTINITEGQGATPLHAACSGAKLEIVKFLLDNGAQVNAKTKEGETPLDWTNKSLEDDPDEASKQIKELLIQKGAKPGDKPKAE